MHYDPTVTGSWSEGYFEYRDREGRLHSTEFAARTKLTLYDSVAHHYLHGVHLNKDVWQVHRNKVKSLTGQELDNYLGYLAIITQQEE